MCCVGDGRGRVGETLGKTLQVSSQDGSFGRTIMSHSCTVGYSRGAPYSPVHHQTKPWSPPSRLRRGRRDVPRPHGRAPPSSPPWHAPRGSPRGAGSAVSAAPACAVSGQSSQYPPPGNSAPLAGPGTPFIPPMACVAVRWQRGAGDVLQCSPAWACAGPPSPPAPPSPSWLTATLLLGSRKSVHRND